MTQLKDQICQELNVVKKRGRKSKKEIELAKQSQFNIKLVEEITNTVEVNTPIEEILNSQLIDDEILSSENEISEEKPIAKKRGRKPKGGKIIQQVLSQNCNNENKPNVILHLKCSLKDLQTNILTDDDDVHSYNFQNSNQSQLLSYDNLKNIEQNNISFNQQIFATNDNHQLKFIDDDAEFENKLLKDDVREVWKKLKVLEHNLHINNICDKKSACFWCTYDFDNPPVYIPKHYIKETYHVYGCFCSPECATAHLMEDNIDVSSKFERYHLLNHIYSKIYDYTKNIKPAPNPYYMLDKYYGNLTIQEYRALLKNERLFLIVDKPLTRILPELHEDNDDFIINNKIIPSNTYQIKKKLQKKQTKNNILTERFGLSQP
jgi:hypothetical protein